MEKSVIFIEKSFILLKNLEKLFLFIIFFVLVLVSNFKKTVKNRFSSLFWSFLYFFSEKKVF
jgi:hypothetical protein